MALNIQDLSVSSPQFAFGERIPDAHSAEGGNAAVDLEISGVPGGTVELAVISHDPDAPLPHGFTHWVIYGLQPTTTRIIGARGAEYRQGPNSRGENSYFGPRPPAGHGTHHYYFWVYALDTAVQGEPDREEFLARYAGNIIEQNRLVGTFSS